MTERVVAVIQAHMASSRLPGKVMLDLNGQPVVERVTRRVARAEEVHQTVVACPDHLSNDVIEYAVPHDVAKIYRGGGIEPDVLNLMYCAAEEYDADTVVRITSDCPLIDPITIDTIISERRKTESDYASNIIRRTYPRGLDTEVFTMESFAQVRIETAGDRFARRHVTPRYRDEEGTYLVHNVAAPERLQRREIRFTLDEPKDYILFDKLFNEFPRSEYIPIEEAINAVDSNQFSKINRDVQQKHVEREN